MKAQPLWDTQEVFAKVDEPPSPRHTAAWAYLVPMDTRRFVLTPNRSFSWAATAVLFVLLGLWVIALAVFSFRNNTWPILGFAGLELIGLAAAFTIHSHRARVFEEVVLTRDTVTWTRHLPSGKTERWQAPLGPAKLSTKAPSEPRSPLSFRYGRQRLDFGLFLTPKDRRSFMEAFQSAQAKQLNQR